MQGERGRRIIFITVLCWRVTGGMTVRCEESCKVNSRFYLLIRLLGREYIDLYMWPEINTLMMP